MPFRPDRLKALREAKGLSQEQLEKLAGVSHSMIAKSEKGKSLPGSETLDRLALALDATIDYLHGRGLEGVDPPTAAARMAFDVFTRDPGLTDERRERCRSALAHADAPKTARGWRSFAEMLELAVGPPRVDSSGGTRLAVVRERRPKSKI